jgi:hypothetical protein
MLIPWARFTAATAGEGGPDAPRADLEIELDRKHYSIYAGAGPAALVGMDVVLVVPPTPAAASIIVSDDHPVGPGLDTDAPACLHGRLILTDAGEPGGMLRGQLPQLASGTNPGWPTVPPPIGKLNLSSKTTRSRTSSSCSAGELDHRVLEHRATASGFEMGIRVKGTAELAPSWFPRPIRWSRRSNRPEAELLEQQSPHRQIDPVLRHPSLTDERARPPALHMRLHQTGHSQPVELFHPFEWCQVLDFPRHRRASVGRDTRRR